MPKATSPNGRESMLLNWPTTPTFTGLEHQEFDLRYPL